MRQINKNKSSSVVTHFTDLSNFGDNPGSLTASYYVPQTKPSALVVLLHGCKQKGELLAQQSGLLGLAKQHNFALLIPQQSLKNNIMRCFNWYSAGDFTRDSGESLSIKNMITTLQHQLGSERNYIMGLSAGGAMTSSMLVNYPDLFTAGAVIAGMPYPGADSLMTAMSCMKKGSSRSADMLMSSAQELNPKQKTWPQLLVWTGESDNVVNPINSSLLAQQWTKLIKTKLKIEQNECTSYQSTQWKDNLNQTQVELVQVAHLGHGIMVNPNEKNGGEVADYLLAAPISTVKYVISFWDLN